MFMVNPIGQEVYARMARFYGMDVTNEIASEYQGKRTLVGASLRVLDRRMMSERDCLAMPLIFNSEPLVDEDIVLLR